ncbi:phage tail assembly protein T [Piscirickettsia salmonis]
MNQLSQELSLSEFNEWLAYYSLEPFGVEKDDHRTALMVSAL